MEERIKTLLTTTDLTFKQIIEQLRSENIPASFNTIRRVNRNNIFRKPRYDAKLTPQQRKELIVILKKTTKPNLSALARHFGVCHGSIWYWWDKLTKLREKHNGVLPANHPALEVDDLDTGSPASSPTELIGDDRRSSAADDYGFNSDNIQICNDELIDPESDPLDLSGEDGENRSDSSVGGSSADPPIDYSRNKQYWPNGEGHEKNRPRDGCRVESLTNLSEQFELIGPVQAKDTSGQYIKLPILMYARIPQ